MLFYKLSVIQLKHYCNIFNILWEKDIRHQRLYWYDGVVLQECNQYNSYRIFIRISTFLASGDQQFWWPRTDEGLNFLSFINRSPCVLFSLTPTAANTDNESRNASVALARRFSNRRWLQSR